MKNKAKIIFHIDLNAFYASVSAINDPYLKDKVFVVGGSAVTSRGVITTASYKARALGIKSAMPISEAIKIYPKVLVVPVNHKEYKKYSNLFIKFLRSYTDRVLVASIDEAYLDVTEITKDIHPLDLAKQMQQKLYEKYELPSSIGIAPTLYLAKMASDLKKPMGITVLRKRDIPKMILPLPIKELHGLGIKTYPYLEKQGIKTIGDFARKENKELILNYMTEENYQKFINSILGNSSNNVDPSKYDIPKSISNETTFSYDIDSYDLLLEELSSLYEVIFKRLIKENLLAKTITIKLRDTNFKTITRSKSLNDYSSDYNTFKDMMEELFYDNYNNKQLRLVGVGYNNIILAKEYEQDYNLFTYQKILNNETWYNINGNEELWWIITIIWKN